MNSVSKQNACNSELDNWFNELDEKTIEIINNNLMKEEDEPDNVFISDNRSDSTMSNDEDRADITIKCVDIDEILFRRTESLTSDELIHDECSIAYFVQLLMEGASNNKFK